MILLNTTIPFLILLNETTYKSVCIEQYNHKSDLS